MTDVAETKKEANYIPLTNKQFLGALFAIIFTLGSIIFGGASYFVSGLVHSVHVLSADTGKNTTAITVIKQEHADCKTEQSEFKKRFISLFDNAEIRFDVQTSDIATLKAQRVANSDLILECLRIVRGK